MSANGRVEDMDKPVYAEVTCHHCGLNVEQADLRQHDPKCFDDDGCLTVDFEIVNVAY